MFKIEHSRGAGNTNALLNVLNSAESILYVEGSGNDGIGTTSPDLLTVNGGVGINNTGSGGGAQFLQSPIIQATHL